MSPSGRQVLIQKKTVENDIKTLEATSCVNQLENVK